MQKGLPPDGRPPDPEGLALCEGCFTVIAVSDVGNMIGITTRTYRGFAIHIECSSDANPPCRATIRRQRQELRPRPGMFIGATEQDVVSQAREAVDRILAGEAARENR